MHWGRIARTTAVFASLWTAAAWGASTDVPKCVGDCDGNNSVAVSELVRSVAIALEEGDLEECRASDRDGDNRVSVSELIAGVTNSLRGCFRVKFTVSRLEENQIGVVGVLDFDGDGTSDLITSRVSGDVEEVAVFLGTGEGRFEHLRSSLVERHEGAGGARARVLTDVDGKWLRRYRYREGPAPDPPSFRWTVLRLQRLGALGRGRRDLH
jgi:hypothetical protein